MASKITKVKKSKVRKTKSPEIYDGFSIASLVLGIVSIVFSFYFLISLTTGIVGLVFAVKQRKANPNKMATAGLVTSIIGVALATLIGLIFMSIFGAFLSMLV